MTGGFATVTSVHMSPASELALRLQRESYTRDAGERLRWSEKASRAREWELPDWRERAAAPQPGGRGISS